MSLRCEALTVSLSAAHSVGSLSRKRLSWDVKEVGSGPPGTLVQAPHFDHEIKDSADDGAAEPSCRTV